MVANGPSDEKICVLLSQSFSQISRVSPPRFLLQHRLGVLICFARLRKSCTHRQDISLAGRLTAKDDSTLPAQLPRKKTKSRDSKAYTCSIILVACCFASNYEAFVRVLANTSNDNQQLLKHQKKLDVN